MTTHVEPPHHPPRPWVNRLAAELANASQWRATVTRRAEELLKQYGLIVIALFILQFAVYTYFFTANLLSNHSMANVFTQRYPSQKTLGEGRWLADIIIMLQGGSGVDSFQMFLAATLQAVNAILLANFLGLKNKIEIFLGGAFLCLYPALLDQYSFSIDHLTFTVGDTLALLAFLHLKNSRHSLVNIASSGFLVMLTLACYQPKIALVCLLCITCILLHLTAKSPDAWSVRRTLREIGAVVAVGALGAICYFISMKLTVQKNSGIRINLNSPGAVLDMIKDAYPATLDYFWAGADYLPAWLQALPLAVIALGCAAVLYKASRNHPLAALFALGLLAAVPLALRASYLINDKTWAGSGRIQCAYGYFMLVLLVFALQTTWLRKIALTMMVALVYFFIVVGTQENNVAAFRSQYEHQFVNRLVSRIETLTGDTKKRPVVVLGLLPEFPRAKFTTYPNVMNQPNMSNSAFPRYRQPELLNHYVGREIFLNPTQSQLQEACIAARGRNPWPDEESVFLVNNTVVVLLEKYRDNMKKTRTSDR